MNYEDELERSRARRSRKRETTVQSSTDTRRRTSRTDERLGTLAEPGSRASRMAGGSHNHRRRRNGGKKKVVLIAVAVVFLLIAAAVGIVYAYINHSFGKLNSQNDFDVQAVENQNISLEMKEKMEKGFWTIAVFGLDSRDSSTGKGNQSDVIMIVNLNRESGEIKLVSVFRDTYLNVSDRNTYNKINAAYAEGGPEQAVKALNKNLDLNITHYAAFNWKAVATAINILGGVDIDISKSEFYYINAFITETVKGTGIGSYQLKSAGVNHLDGVQAVAYGRLRLMDSDYARTERQRIVIQKAFEKAKKADLATLNSLVGNMSAMCATNIDIGDILPMAKNISKYHLGDSMGFPAARGEQRMKIGSNSLSCVIPQTLVSNVTSLHSFLFNEEDYTPSSTVQTIGKKIADLSGLSKAGQAIDHVATDQGYVPKATTTAVAETEELAQSSEGESTSEGESESSTGEGESGSAAESGSGSGLTPGGSSAAVTDAYGQPVTSEAYPGQNPGQHPGQGTTAAGGTESRPQSPLDMTTGGQTMEQGPGMPSTSAQSTTAAVTEATTAAQSPTSQTTAPTQGTAIIVVEPTTQGEGPGLETTAPVAQTAAAPSSPADMTTAGQQ